MELEDIDQERLDIGVFWLFRERSLFMAGVGAEEKMVG